MLHENDFDDIDNPLRYGLVLAIITNVLAAIGVFASGLVLWALWRWVCV